MTNQDSSTHVELYKKYRPAVWSDLVGQEKVARSLQAAVTKNALPTAYGFFGPRGTGKTSSALLLAKAINCLNVQPEGNPCNQCDVCTAIDSGSQLGVNYISMANNGSVDDVRTLVQRARLSAPVKRQVWILDEVHNLSKAAFDALLIPLEDKDMPALFILCSTEVEKVPDTIHSRIQARRFGLVTPNVMSDFLVSILEKEHIAVEQAQIDEAVRQGRGSVRDALSALEGILSTGDIATPVEAELLEALGTRNLSRCLEVIAEAHSQGYEGQDLAEQLFSDLRDLLLLICGADKTLVAVPPVKNLKNVAKGLLGRKGVEIMAQEIGESLRHMTLGADSRIHLEIAIVKGLDKLSKLQKILESRNNE